MRTGCRMLLALMQTAAAATPMRWQPIQLRCWRSCRAAWSPSGAATPSRWPACGPARRCSTWAAARDSTASSPRSKWARQGAVIGVDFTQDMIDRATENAGKLGLGNVTFKHGDIEALPLADATVDVVMSNCVINLTPDKDAVFREAFRVLRPGGRLVVSDIVLSRPATEAEMQDMALLTGCISGSLPDAEYAETVRRAGFVEVTVVAAPLAEEMAEGQFWYSATISGYKA